MPSQIVNAGGARKQWALFPDQIIDCKRDIEVLLRTRWPTTLTRPQFQRVSGAKATVGAALQKRLAALQESHPGVALEEQPDRFHVSIPDILRTGHERHFALVAQRFLDYVENLQSLPAWEKPNIAREALRHDERRPACAPEFSEAITN